jgi:hypothetical protein
MASRVFLVAWIITLLLTVHALSNLATFEALKIWVSIFEHVPFNISRYDFYIQI